jgi:hypothetical protein
VDAELRTATSVSGLLERTLVHVPDEVLDAPPKQWLAEAQLPPVHSAATLPRRLALQEELQDRDEQLTARVAVEA